MYLPSVGVCLLLAGVVARVSDGFGVRLAQSVLLVILVVAVLVIGHLWLNRDAVEQRAPSRVGKALPGSTNSPLETDVTSDARTTLFPRDAGFDSSGGASISESEIDAFVVALETEPDPFRLLAG